MKVYFAGSIRGGRKDKEKYFELIEFLAEQAEVLTEHVGSKSLGNEGEKQLRDDLIYQRDLDWLCSADAVVAEVSTPSLGVGYEIGVAEKTGKPILFASLMKTKTNSVSPPCCQAIPTSKS